jgi:Zn-dependent protease with chaperone function
MNFFEQQERSHRATQKLLGLFAGAVLFTSTNVYFAIMLSINLSPWKAVIFGEAGCPVSDIKNSLSWRSAAPVVPSASSQSNLEVKGGRSFSGFSGGSRRSLGDSLDIPGNRSYRSYVRVGADGQLGKPIECRTPAVWFDARVFFWSMLITSSIIGSTSWLKIRQLRAGGAVIAVELGGRRVLFEVATPQEQQLLNIVEEMAIAAAIKVPGVYLLDRELGINAFAAGDTIEDAVIGITQGSLNALTRDELQGVIAHEFSHILNGDMAMNIRLTGLLHGVLWIHLLGRIISDVSLVTDRRTNFWMLGILLRIIGFSGFLSGRLIQSAISRQREFLADASAVQFTRNPDGIASALARIGRESSQIDSPYAETASHMFFSPALEGYWFRDWLATHPPITARLKIITGVGSKLGTKIIFRGAALPTIKAIAPLGESLMQSSESPTVAADQTMARLYTLLIDPHLEQVQLAALTRLIDPPVMEQITAIRATGQSLSLAKIDRYLATILETEHREQFLKSSYQMVVLLPPDNWLNSMAYLIFQHRLQPPQIVEVYQAIEEVGVEIRQVLGTLAHHISPTDSAAAFAVALLRLPSAVNGEFPPTLPWREFHHSLAKIACATPKIKQLTITAGLEMLTSHRQTTTAGVDLLRTIVILLDCPIPPILDQLTAKITKSLHFEQSKTKQPA